MFEADTRLSSEVDCATEQVVKLVPQEIGWQPEAGMVDTLVYLDQNIHIPTTWYSARTAAWLPSDGPCGPEAGMSPINRLVKRLTRCARCGLDIERPMKEWNMQPRDGRGPALHVKHYSCPQCGKKFRVADKLVGA